MKKTIISLALAFLGIANLYAVKAKPGIAKIMLADGTMACATLHGDETFHYYMLLDGTPLRETQDGKVDRNVFLNALGQSFYSMSLLMALFTTLPAAAGTFSALPVQAYTLISSPSEKVCVL